MDVHLREIAANAYRYAKAHGATESEATQVADHVVSRTRKAAEYAVTHGGTDPSRWQR